MDEYLTLIKLAVIAGSFLLALLLESLILPQILRIAYKKRLYDLPNARKVHKTPTPRLGGISFMPVIVIVLGLMAVARLRWVTDTVLSQNVTNQTMIYILFAMGLMLLYLIGAVDDLRTMDKQLRRIVWNYGNTVLDWNTTNCLCFCVRHQCHQPY